MEKLDSGYVYTDHSELKKCANWFRRNQRQVPGMEVGSRINGDRILYVGKQPPDYLRMMQTLPEIFGQQPVDCTPEKVDKMAICAVLKIATSGMTPMEAMVFLGRLAGRPQKELAEILQVAQGTVSKLGDSALRKIRATEN